MADGHLVNGTRLDLYAIESDWVDMWGVPETSGGDLSVPYMVGEIPGNRTLKGRDYTLGLTVVGDSRDDYETKCAALVALVFQAGAVLTLGREFNGVTKTAQARYVSGLPLVQIGGASSARALVRWRLYSGDFA